MEAELVKRAQIPFTAIPAAGVHGVGMRALPGNLLQLGRGLLAARRLLRKFNPDVILFTGGFIAAPVALAARLPGLANRPAILLYIPDIQPGWALKTLAPLADHAAITVEDTRRSLPIRLPATVTGYPIRPDLKVWDKTQARQALGLDGDRPVLLVSGGSRGARAINRAILGVLPELLQEMQVVHITGHADWPEMETAWRGLAAQLPAELTIRYHAHPFLHEEMGAAMTAADLALSRAGASCLGEYPYFGLPAILAPYPYAWRYQQVNAQYLVDRGAAIVLEDADLPTRLLPTASKLMRDLQRRQSMQQAMHSLARPQASGEIGALLLRLAGSARTTSGRKQRRN
jgi:UDP-N-acetylglucosamine--N-acetylmuramyl-(pentapeptide) pyrophosphoryl-undecaprenol N-acetylglucosamine transferase